MYLVKRIAVGVVTLGVTSTYFYKQHLYEKELFDRMNYLLQHPEELSGVYIQLRRPNILFPRYFQSILPHHQSLKMILDDGTFRQVGLGKSNSDSNSNSWLESEFVLHKGDKYELLNQIEISLPIECWVDYKRKFGHWPKDINIMTLIEITKTREEAKVDDVNNLYRATFGKMARDDNGDFIFTSCRSAAMYAIREEEKRRLNE